MSEQSSNPNRDNAPLSLKATLYVVRKALGMYAYAKYGRDGSIILEDTILGLCEGSIIAPKLCHPTEEAQGELSVRQAHGGQLVGYDFRRPEYLPRAADFPHFTQESEGTCNAFLVDEVERNDPNMLNDISYIDFYSAEVLFTFDKPTLERLVEAGMLFVRTHEEAYEEAGATEHIDGLRSRGLANTLVHQVAKKAHALVCLLPDDGEPKPKKEKTLVLDQLPGVLAHS